MVASIILGACAVACVGLAVAVKSALTIADALNDLGADEYEYDKEAW